MRFFFLDIETNSESLEFNKDEQEIIQIWIYNSETKEKFNRNINIWKPLSENIKRLTWISDNDLKTWVDLKTALNDALNFLWNKEDTVIVWHNLEDFDLYILWKNDDRFFEYDYLDTLHLFIFLFPWLSSYSVQELYKKFINSEYFERHQALQDSIDEFELFSKILNTGFISKYYERNWKDISFVKNLLKKYNWWLNIHCYNFTFLESIFSNVKLEDYVWLKNKMLEKRFYNYQQEHINHLKTSRENWDSSNHTINTISTEWMNKAYDDFINNTNSNFRDAQYQMIQHIKDVLNKENKNLFIEAWTWTWKTYSYLLPAVEFSKKNKWKSIYIATGTKVLQNQIIEKDIPTINKYYPDIKFELLKANSEWIALDNVPFKWPLSFRDLALWNWLYRWNFYTSDIHFSLQSRLSISKLESYSSWNMEERALDDYYWYRWKLKHQLKNWDIFIINHAFLISNFNQVHKDRYTWINYFTENSSISPYGYFIIDEWHNLESVIRDFLSLDYTKAQFDKVMSLFNSWSNFNILTYINKSIEKDKEYLENLKLNFNRDNNNEIHQQEHLIQISEKVKEIILNRITSKENTYLFKIYNQFLDDFKNTKFCKFAIDDIQKLRDQGYDTSISEYDKSTFNTLYLSDWLSNFLSYTYQILKNLYQDIYCNVWSYWLDILDYAIEYFESWIQLLSDTWLKNYFFSSVVELTETWNSLKNFWFKWIALDLHSWAQFLNISSWNIILSATLFDQGNESYVLREIFKNEYNFAKIKKYPSPFNYKAQRKIYWIRDTNPSTLETKMDEFIEKYGWRTLILTTTLANKRRIANHCKNKYEKEGIMVLMHKSWNVTSSTNQKNVQCLRDNPNTILIWSKSYAEWVDVPWDNLKLVIIDKLPFLPPTPFIKFQDKKRKSKWDRYVYKFLCSIDFRQSIWRLIRTKNDTWDILILDERIFLPSWQFFRDYIEWEIIVEL